MPTETPDTPSDIGLIGLAVMGQNLVLNMADHGYAVSVYNRTTSTMQDFIDENHKAEPSADRVHGYAELEDFVKSIKKPRKIVLLVKSSAVLPSDRDAVDKVIDQLTPLLDKGDIIIDGGNSNWNATIRREKDLSEAGFNFIGTGVSGGEVGARFGPSLMPGGTRRGLGQPRTHLEGHRRQGRPRNRQAHRGLRPRQARHRGRALHRLHRTRRRGPLRQDGPQRHRVHRHAAHLRGLPPHEGPAGHGPRRDVRGLRRLEPGRPRQLPHRDHHRHPPAEGPRPGSRLLVDAVLDTAGQKGTGKWTAQNALDMGIPANAIAEAVFARFISAIKDERVEASKTLQGPEGRRSSTATRQS